MHKPSALFLFVALMMSSRIFSQEISFSGANNLFVRHLQSGSNVVAGDLDITLSGAPTATTANTQWFYCWGTSGCAPTNPLTPGSPVPLPGGFSIEANPGGSLRVRITGAGISPGEYPFAIRAMVSGAGGGIRTREYRLVVRHPLRMVFVLDRSGSMECEPGDDSVLGWPGCLIASPNRRWDLLQDAIRAFIGKLTANYTLTDDQFSVIYFAGSLTDPAPLVNNAALKFTSVANFTGPLPPPIVPTAGILLNMTTPPREAAADPRLARDGTSIGAGLREAYDNRFTPSPGANFRKVVVLFTDGEQNAYPLITETGAAPGKQYLASPGAIAANLTAATDIEVFTVGVGNTPAFNTILDNMASVSSNDFQVTPGNLGDFSSDLATLAFNEIYNTSTPQLIRYDRHNWTNGPVQSDFVCNKKVSRLIFEAYFDTPTAQRNDFVILKDGVEVTKYAQRNSGHYINSFTFDLAQIPDLSSEGKWSYMVSNKLKAPQTVKLFATADDHHIGFDGYLTQPKVRVGDKINPTVRLSQYDKPVTDATVQAIILKPGEDLGDLLARTQTPTLPPKHPETGTCASQKYSHLATADPAAFAKLKTLTPNVIDLKHTGNGVYSGSYNNVDVSGVYKIVYQVKANSADLGDIERMKEQTQVVRFAPVNLNLGKNGVKVSKDGSVNYFTLQFQPAYRDPNGKTRLAGPGFENAIEVQNNNGKQSGVQDECDGSYTIRFSDARSNPDIRLLLTDQVVYTGKALNFGSTTSDDQRKWHISVHGGLTFPQGDLDTLYNSGPYGEVNLGWQFSKVLGLEAVGGHYRFENDFDITGTSLYLGARLNVGGSLRLRLAGGGGWYKPKNNDATGAYSFRAGLEKIFTSSVSLTLEGAYFNLPDPQISFATAGLGLRFFF